MFSNKRLLIAGAAGTLGQSVAAVAHQQGAGVIGLDTAESADIPGLNAV